MRAVLASESVEAFEDAEAAPGRRRGPADGAIRTQKQVAAMLGITPQAVGCYERRAIRKFQKEFVEMFRDKENPC